MFSLVSGLYDTYLSPKELRVVLVGANGVGKTALLERLKVTDFSSIQSKASASTTMTTTELPLPPPKILQALSECAGMPPLDGSNPKDSHSAKPANQDENKSSADNKKATTPSSSTTTKPASSANQTKLTTVAPSPTAAAIAPAKPKRRLFFCPAPKRYTQSKDESDDDEEEELMQQLQAPSDPETNPITNRERTHSQEFSVSSLDLMDNNTGEPDEGAFQTIPVSSTSEQQPVSDEPAIPKQNSLQVIGNDSNSNPQEYHKLPNKKMLPLHKIRPTSESTYNKHQLMSMYIPDL